MADVVSDDADAIPTPLAREVADRPVPEPVEHEGDTSKKVEVKVVASEEIHESSKGDGKEKRGRGDSLDRVNAALVLSVAAVAVVGAIVAITKKLRET